MTVLTQETETAMKRSRAANADMKNEMDRFESYEDEVYSAQKKVAQLEEELDQAATNIKLSSERAEENDKVIVDLELQITALNRRISLLDDEKKRFSEKTRINTSKLAEFERQHDEHEAGRKAAEAKCQQLDEKIELNEGALFDARRVAEDSNHKYEETARKVKIVTHQLACVIERAEDFEANSRETEIKVRDLQERVREMEQTNLVNLGKEETIEAKIHDMTDQFAIADSRAEFAERSVDKLETSIDNLLSDLYQQKIAYKTISQKLDTTLNDMMQLHQ